MKSDKIPAWACSRCETYEGVDSKEMTLFGGVHARLCEKCNNDWNLVYDLKEWTRVGQIDMEVSALLEMSNQPGADYRKELEVLRAEKEALRKFFREEGRRFMLDLKEVEQPKA